MKNICSQMRNRLFFLILGGAAAMRRKPWAVNHIPAMEPRKSVASLNVAVDETPVSRSLGPYGSFAPVVKKVAPAVVKIVTTATIKQPSLQQEPGFNDPFWRRFFGDQFGQMRPPNQFGSRREHGLGSGVIV